MQKTADCVGVWWRRRGGGSGSGGGGPARTALRTLQAVADCAYIGFHLYCFSILSSLILWALPIGTFPDTNFVNCSIEITPGLVTYTVLYWRCCTTRFSAHLWQQYVRSISKKNWAAFITTKKIWLYWMYSDPQTFTIFIIWDSRYNLYNTKDPVGKVLQIMQSMCIVHCAMYYSEAIEPKACALCNVLFRS